MRIFALRLLWILPRLQLRSELNSGDTAWMLTATALVLFMTLPGLALFYGGLVRTRNVLSVLMQCFAITCVVSVLWVLFGFTAWRLPRAARSSAACQQVLLAGVARRTR